MDAPPEQNYRDTLAEDRPDERLPFLWDGPNQASDGVFLPRVFIGSGYHAPRDDGEEAELELVILITGRAALHPEDWTQTWIQLSTDIDSVQRLENLYANRLRSIRTGSPIIPGLTRHQRQLVEDVLLAFWAFSRPSQSAPIPAGDWPEFYREMTRGIPVGAFVRAEAHLQRVQAWLYNRYDERLYRHIPLSDREAVISQVEQAPAQ